MSGILNAFVGGSYAGVPGAPTIGTATATSSSAISVSFTAPSYNGGSPITGYQVACTSSGTNTATGSSSPISVTGLSAGTSYTFHVRAQNAIGYGSYSGNATASTYAAPGSQSYTTAGTYCWVAPTGVTSISVVTVGGGGGAGRNNRAANGGGALAYVNNITVTPGNTYRVVVGAGGIASTNQQRHAGCNSYMLCSNGSTTLVSAGGAPSNSSCPLLRAPGGSVIVGTGTSGGTAWRGGGGAGGYAFRSCTGGYGGSCGYASSSNWGQNGQYGGGGGGGGTYCYSACCCRSIYIGAGGGGGAGLYGGLCVGNGGGAYQSGGGAGGASGGGGTAGGSGGTSGLGNLAGATGGSGGKYGGGGGTGIGCCNAVGAGGTGAVRIIWPGSTRSFPSTSAGSP